MRETCHMIIWSALEIIHDLLGSLRVLAAEHLHETMVPSNLDVA